MLFSQRSALICLATLWFFSACRPPEVPQASLSDDQIALIMADLAVAEAGTHMLSGPSKDSLFRLYSRQIFEIRKTNFDEYEASLRVVANDEQRMLTIAQKAETIINDLQKDLKPDSTGQKQTVNTPQ